MSDFDNKNRGAIWKNDKKEKPSHPDFKGSLNVEGVEYWVSAWKRKDGASDRAPPLSFQVERKDANRATGLKDDPRVTTGRKRDAIEEALDDEVPF